MRFARRTGAPVLPVRVQARNSALFYGASSVFRQAGTALLAREMFARRQRPISLRIGTPMQLDRTAPSARVAEDMRSALYALRCQPAAAPPPEQEPIAPAMPTRSVCTAIAQTELLGQTGDGKQIRLAQLRAGDPLLLEIGRLREITFRAVGEGSGRDRDLDAFDPDYEHIVLWDAQCARIAGAYRIARGARILASRGLPGLYTASLFRYADEAIVRLAQGMELGRSFVVPDYWGSRSLDYLWQGIGAYLRRHPHVRYLFGAVSISSALPAQAREQIVAYYAQHYGATDALACATRPFEYRPMPDAFAQLDAQSGMQLLKANLRAVGVQIPVLYKQYAELCEPGGVRFLAFGVDPAFSDAVDGLVEVDLQRLLPQKRRRYLHPREVHAAA